MQYGMRTQRMCLFFTMAAEYVKDYSRTQSYPNPRPVVSEYHAGIIYHCASSSDTSRPSSPQLTKLMPFWCCAIVCNG